MTNRIPTTISSFLLSSLLFLTVASAAPTPVAPLWPKIEPEKAPELATRFHDALGEGLTSGGLVTMPASQVRSKLTGPQATTSCFSGPCVTGAASALGTSQIATASITAVGKNYRIEVTVYDGTQVVGHARGRCDVCTFAEAIAATSGVAGKAATARKTGGGAPVVPAVVAARVPVAGSGAVGPSVGASAAAASTAAKGPRGVRPAPAAPPVPRAAPVVAARATDPAPGDERAFTPTVAARPSSGRTRADWQLWGGIGAAGAGVVAIAIGAPLVAMDGKGTQCSGPSKPNNANCKELYSTAAGGWFLTSVGIASLVGSGVLFYLYFSGDPPRSAVSRQAYLDRLSIGPTMDGGLMLGASGRF